MPGGCDACYICYMADLNIRDIDVTLLAELKKSASLRGMTLRSHCIELLSHPVITVTRPAEIVVDAPAVQRQPAPPKPRPQDEVPLPAVQPFLQQATTLVRPTHNKATCRLYGCQLCAKTEAPG